MPGCADTPGLNPMDHTPNAVFEALCHGYVVACAGVRGRTSGMETTEFFVGANGKEQASAKGAWVGRAPALLVDMKAAIRYLRHNREHIPWNTEQIITNETSAGGTVMRPTNSNGTAMLFHNIKGRPNAKVAIGMVGTRERVSSLFRCAKEDVGKLLCRCAANPVQPIVTDEKAPCQDVVHLATDSDFDLNKLVPAPTNTPVDAGPYITLGMCYAGIS